MSGPDLDDPNLSLGMLFFQCPAAISVFLAHRMVCFGCPISPFHTISEACAEYGLDESAFRAELHMALAQ